MGSDKPEKSSITARARGRVVALTGAASFLGKNLIGVLEEDAPTLRVIAIDVKAPDTAGPKRATPSSGPRDQQLPFASSGVSWSISREIGTSRGRERR